jgi:hypothetical protein
MHARCVSYTIIMRDETWSTPYIHNTGYRSYTLTVTRTPAPVDADVTVRLTASSPIDHLQNGTV